MKRHALLLSIALCLNSVWAAGEDLPEPVQEALPEPLTLEGALAGINHDHPLLMSARASTAQAESELIRARAQDDLSIALALEGRRIDPSEQNANQDTDDSRAILSAQKTLYDFGRTGHAKQAAQLKLNASENQQALQTQLHRQTVIENFFKVLIADLTFEWSNEGMALSYVQLDNARERHELGEISDIDLLALENTYQRDLIQRRRAELAQRQSRTRLALALGRPGELSSDLLPPDLPGLKNPLPELDKVLEEASANNLTLQSLRAQLEAAEETRKSAKADRYPSLYAQFEAAEYRREFGSRDPLTAILGLNIPIYQGERVNGKTAAAVANMQSIRALMFAEDYRLNEQVLTTYQEVQALTAQLEQAEVQNEFRELYLDRSRAQYDLEIKTDLGDAMVAQTDARRFSAQTRFDLALARERLATLTQNPAYSALQPAVATEESQ